MPVAGRARFRAHGREGVRGAFEELAGTAPQDARYRERLSRLAYALGALRKMEKEKETAAALLWRSQRTYPDDF